MAQCLTSPLLQCLQSPEIAKKTALLEEQCAALAAENEKLRTRLREKEAKEAADEKSMGPAGVGVSLHRRGSLQYGSHTFSKRKDDDNTLTSAAAIVASAEATANHQRSLVQVSIDNASDPLVSQVTVRAPNRRRLLGDMSGALIGSGFAVHTAAIQADGTSDLAVLRFSLLENGRQISEEERLHQIEQRLKHASSGREGLAGGVKRLVVPESVRPSPPWPHEPLDYETPAKAVEAVWVETLRAALGPRSEAAFGTFSCANAKRLAVDLLPEMQRFLIPPDVDVSFEEVSGGNGAWLILLESHDARLTLAGAGQDPRVRRRMSSSAPPPPPPKLTHAATMPVGLHPGQCADSGNPVAPGHHPSPVAVKNPAGRRGSTITRISVAAVAEAALAANRAEGGLSGRLSARSISGADDRSLPSEVILPAGGLLWDTITPASLPIPPAPAGLPGVLGATGSPTAVAGVADMSRLTPARQGLRWKSFRSLEEEDGLGLTVRACPLSTVRQRLVTLREASAREHAQVLADIPLFAPLSPHELLALCRRATMVEVPPRHTVLPRPDKEELDDPFNPGTRLEREQRAELREVVTESTFGLVLAGALQVTLETTGLDQSGNTNGNNGNGGNGDEALPSVLPLAHLGPRDTFGELADAESRLAFFQSGGRIVASEMGARLLCWPRDSILNNELTKLASLTGGTSLLEQSWMARTPLALCLSEPSLLGLLHPTRLSQARSREQGLTTAGQLDPKRATMLVLGGEVFRTPSAFVEVAIKEDVSPLPSPSPQRRSLSSRASSTSSLGSAPSPAEDGCQLLVEARMPQDYHSLEAVANHIEEDNLGLTLRRAASKTSADGIITDSFHITAPVPSGSTREQATENLRSQLKLLGATRMRAGELVLTLAKDGTSRLTRCQPALQSGTPAPTSRWARLASSRITEALDPPVALFDIGVFGVTLALCTGPFAAAWRAYLYCHAPHLLPESMEGITDAHAALQTAAAARAAREGGGFAESRAAPSSDSQIGVVPPTPRLTEGEEWRQAICAFLLYRLRLEAGVAELKMKFTELALGAKLGEGGFGVVRLARQRVSGALYAVKSIEKQRIRKVTEQRTFELLERERRTLQLIGNHNATGLTRLVCAAHDAEWLRIVMPAFLAGDLSGLLEGVGDGKGLNEDAVQFYTGCIILGLSKLHSFGVAYRDMKPENILMSGDGWPVLSDFGLVAFLDVSTSGGRAYTMCGTPEFMAPEMISGDGHDTDVDWWALGVTICELTTLNTPFLEESESSDYPDSCYKRILSGTYVDSFRNSHYRRLGSRTAALVDALLKADTAMRLGARRRGVESVRIHPFFWGLSWDALENQQAKPPHAGYCRRKSAKFTDAVKENAFTPPATPLRGGSKKRDSQDAATAALDKMFDFSAWGEEME